MIDWCVSADVSWFSYCWVTGKVFLFARYLYVMREHEHSAGRAFQFFQLQLVSHSRTWKQIGKSYGCFCGQPEPKHHKSPKTLSPPISSGGVSCIYELYDEDLNGAD